MPLTKVSQRIQWGIFPGQMTDAQFWLFGCQPELSTFGTWNENVLTWEVAFPQKESGGMAEAGTTSSVGRRVPHFDAVL